VQHREDEAAAVDEHPGDVREQLGEAIDVGDTEVADGDVELVAAEQPRRGDVGTDVGDGEPGVVGVCTVQQTSRQVDAATCAAPRSASSRATRPWPQARSTTRRPATGPVRSSSACVAGTE
jgi:hypothetical protein